MANLISTFGLGTIVVILLIAIPCIIGFITWCKNVWAKREKFKQDSIEEGKRLEMEMEKKEARLAKGEARMDNLESDAHDLKELVGRQARLIELLTKSDELNIKAWIKEQHEKWIKCGCIDSQILDLLEQRFEIYEAEGGNSWAKKLVEELRALPTISAIPIAQAFKE